MADKHFPSLMAYTNRAGFLLAQGIPTAHIAVYFPTTSLWLGHNDSEKSTFDIAQRLLESQHDFDFIDEYSLTTGTTLGKDCLINKSGQEYNTIIIPSINVISKAACNRLDAFIKRGGRVIFTGGLPAIVTDKNFLTASPAISGNLRGLETSVPLSALNSLPSDLQLDLPAASLKYLHRAWKDADLYFLFNESDRPLTRTVTLKASGKAQEWNAENATTHDLKATAVTDGLLQLNIELKPYETKFIVIGSGL